MGKLLVVLALISLAFLQVGSYVFPSDPIMWLAASSASYTVVRLALMGFLVLLLVTNPPRHIVLRSVAEGLAIVLLLTVAYLTYNNGMSALDTLAFGAAGVAMGIVALEINYVVEDVVDLEALRQAKHGGPLIQK